MDPLTPKCAREHLESDQKAIEWTCEQIRQLRPDWWRRASERYQEEFDKPIECKPVQEVNARFYRANTWLRETVKAHGLGDGVKQMDRKD